MPTVLTCSALFVMVMISAPSDSWEWFTHILQGCFMDTAAVLTLSMPVKLPLTHWGRMTHICVGKLTIIGSDSGLSPGWRQAIIWTNAGILLIGPWGTNFSEILISIQTFSFKKMHLKMSAKWCPFCLGLNVLRICQTNQSLPNHNKTSAVQCLLTYCIYFVTFPDTS